LSKRVRLPLGVVDCVLERDWGGVKEVEVEDKDCWDIESEEREDATDAVSAEDLAFGVEESGAARVTIFTPMPSLLLAGMRRVV
jgi:hypothetical protein